VSWGGEQVVVGAILKMGGKEWQPKVWCEGEGGNIASHWFSSALPDGRRGTLPNKKTPKCRVGKNQKTAPGGHWERGGNGGDVKTGRGRCLAPVGTL